MEIKIVFILLLIHDKVMCRALVPEDEGRKEKVLVPEDGFPGMENLLNEARNTPGIGAWKKPPKPVVHEAFRVCKACGGKISRQGHCHCSFNKQH
jgi:hypothetical protein